MEKKTVLSGIQPSGILTLGNYVGALRNWSLLQQDDRFCYYCVANLHAITVKQDDQWPLRSETVRNIQLVFPFQSAMPDEFLFIS